MSLVRIVQLVCDIAGCYNAYEAEFGDLESGTDQRRKAALLGWRRSAGNDICPGHKPPFRFRSEADDD